MFQRPTAPEFLDVIGIDTDRTDAKPKAAARSLEGTSNHVEAALALIGVVPLEFNGEAARAGQTTHGVEANAIPVSSILRSRDANGETCSRSRTAERALLTGLPLWLADQLALLVVFSTCWLTYRVIPFVTAEMISTMWFQMTAAISVVHMATRLYPGSGLTAVAELRRLAVSTTAALLAVVAWMSLSHRLSALQADSGSLFVMLTVACVTISVTQWAFRRWTRSTLANHWWWGERAIVVADGAQGIAICRALSSQPELGLRTVGIVANPDDCHDSLSSRPVRYLGPVENIVPIAAESGAAFGIIALSHQSPQKISLLLDELVVATPHLLIVGDGDFGRRWCGGFEIGHLRFRRTDDRLFAAGSRLLKRMMDVVLAVVAGVLLLPVIAGVYVLVKLSSPGVGIFSHERVGRGSRPFRCWKFRTMVKDAEARLQEHLDSNPALKAEWERTHKLKSDPRWVPVLCFLRQTGLDELPQLWNVIRGEMSLVGPRPIVTDEIARYAQHFKVCNRVLPGMTGWWQISGHSNTTYERRIELDSFYARNWSPWFDLYILMRTIRVVVSRDGAY